MANELFDGAALAIDLQSAFGTVNSTIAGLSGSLSSTDGIVLGDKGSGDAESGIVLPDLEAVYREVAQVQGTFTKQADAFLRAAVNNLAITVAIQGNGATSTPAAGEGKPLAGLDTLWELAGMTGANGTNPVYEYTPFAGTRYATVKLWHGDLSFVFQDVTVESLAMVFSASASALATFSLSVGSINAAADAITFPTLDYGTQASLANPPVEGVGFAWGAAHPSDEKGWEADLTVNVANEIETLTDSNVATTGEFFSQTTRTISVDGRMYVSGDDSDGDYQALINTSAPTADLSFQLGTVAGPAATLNAALVECNNLQNRAFKYDRTGTGLVAEVADARCTSTTAGTEFKLTFN